MKTTTNKLNNELRRAIIENTADLQEHLTLIDNDTISLFNNKFNYKFDVITLKDAKTFVKLLNDAIKLDTNFNKLNVKSTTYVHLKEQVNLHKKDLNELTKDFKKDLQEITKAIKDSQPLSEGQEALKALKEQKTSNLNKAKQKFNNCIDTKIEVIKNLLEETKVMITTQTQIEKLETLLDNE
jgi:hypothetical protein